MWYFVSIQIFVNIINIFNKTNKVHIKYIIEINFFDWNFSMKHHNNKLMKFLYNKIYNKHINSLELMKNYNEYVKIFWVGLMDGDGSIQVNHWKNKILQYRLVINMSNIETNYHMLIEISKVIGGTVRLTNKGLNVIWVVNNKQEVEKIIKIFNTYPPLTSKKICQLTFLRKCLYDDISVKSYLINRNLKYNNQINLINSNLNFIKPKYYKE